MNQQAVRRAVLDTRRTVEQAVRLVKLVRALTEEERREANRIVREQPWFTEAEEFIGDPFPR